KDWLADMNVRYMTPEERGAYIELMAIEWNEIGIPDDDNALAVLSGLGEKWSNGSGEKIRKCFKRRGKKLIHPRLEKERKKQQEWKLKCSMGGKKSVSMRKVKVKKGKGSSTNPPTLVQVKGNSSSSFSSAFAFTSLKKRIDKGDEIESPDWIPQEPWDGFIEMREKKKSPLTDHALKILVNKLKDFKSKGADIGKILDQSTESSWKSIYALKDGGSNGQGSSRQGTSGQAGGGEDYNKGTIGPD
ncbi:MAG: DUF1376 domain-containing protein, partial [Deltaproteobacteria bacterium]|nr:DUF1376 domain-containing protein [Deltaproteobacteria bacterium]